MILLLKCSLTWVTLVVCILTRNQILASATQILSNYHYTRYTQFFILSTGPLLGNLFELRLRGTQVTNLLGSHKNRLNWTSDWDWAAFEKWD